MKTILYITDLYYNAKGRKYYEEDIYITSRLKPFFNILIAHPQQAITFLDTADILVYRNIGCVIEFEDYFRNFVQTVEERNILTFNSFDGKADQKGKQYLLDLQALGYPVIPTTERIEDIGSLGNPDKFIVKLKNGADSIGMEMLTREELFTVKPEGKLIQPWIDFEYEVSFYYLNNKFQYAMYAPNKQRRWDLTEYTPTLQDLEFAHQFLEWNNMTRGITRVDACRLKDGSLLLVELEDLNPFLSIELLPEEKRNNFLQNFILALNEMPEFALSEDKQLSFSH